MVRLPWGSVGVAVPGTKPKPDGQKRNRVKPTFEWVEVLDVPFEGGASLPSRRPSGGPWPARTKRWWAVISRMPHCVLWDEADWDYALDVAVVHARFDEGDMRVAAELRNREKPLGHLWSTRRDLRIRYVPASAQLEDAADVTRMDDYRAALG